MADVESRWGAYADIAVSRFPHRAPPNRTGPSQSIRLSQSALTNQQPGVLASSAAFWGLVPHVRFHLHRQLCRPSPCARLSRAQSTTAAPPQGVSSVPSPPSLSTSSVKTPWFPGSDRPLCP